MTISPPAKVKNEEFNGYPVHASGIDSLYVNVDVHWENDGFFKYLSMLKERAIESKKEIMGLTKQDELNQCWPFMIKPHGGNGYAWLLENKDMRINIGNWLKPISRPSVSVIFSSEMLWRLGEREAVLQLISLLHAQGAKRVVVKPSRVDLCVDLLLPESLWVREILDFAVTRAGYDAPHRNRKKLTGISIGKGNISFKMYDKPLEIRQQSRKFWMYDIWKLKSIPKGYKMIRCEFVFRREVLVELGVDQWDDVLAHCDSLWTYATQRWLKFRDNPGKHHTQRKTQPWWVAVQNGFLGVQDAMSAVRAKAIKTEKERAKAQAMGHLTSLAALQMEEDGIDLLHLPSLTNLLYGMFNDDPDIEKCFLENVLQKRIKNHRGEEKWKEACQLRRERGLPNSDQRGGGF
ncbi:MAG: hypothetical protein IH613_10890 [Desulfuromonadales bacterium]|nr:hypothetical protein [Desulfuromonadales bacterium]